MKELEKVLRYLKEENESILKKNFENKLSQGDFKTIDNLVHYLKVETNGKNKKRDVKKALTNLGFSKEEAISIYEKISNYQRNINPFDKMPKDVVTKAIESNISWATILRALNVPDKNSTYRQKQLQKWALDNNINTSHIKGQGWNKDNFQKEILGQTNIDLKKNDRRRKLKRQYIIELKKRGLPIKCEVCGLSESYNGKPLTLQVHHGSKGPEDQTFENLHLLCPTCHALTDNYCGRRIDPEATEEKIKKIGPELFVGLESPENKPEGKTKYTSNPLSRLKKKIINSGREERCENCGKSVWIKNGKYVKIPLQVHHLTSSKNNSLDQLQLLCPNCHSQTLNYAGKGINNKL